MLIIKPTHAFLKEEKDYFKKSDPYCIFYLGKEPKQLRSKTHSLGGK